MKIATNFIVSLAALGALMATTASQATNVAELPLKASVLAKPNVIFGMDESGSMDAEVMIDGNVQGWFYGNTSSTTLYPSGARRTGALAQLGSDEDGIEQLQPDDTLIDRGVVHEALHTKQALLAEAGVAGFASTQMCFDIDQWKKWAAAERAAGFTLPLHLGVPGVIDRAKLLTMGARLGIGSSMRFVKKNSSTLFKLFSPSGYDPSKLITPMSKVARDLNIEGLHLFTFNNVEATAEWQARQLAKLA